MKKNTKKILAFSVLAMFIFMFAMQMVVAENGESDSAGLAKAEADLLDKFDSDNNPIGGWFADWETGKDFSSNIAKYLFWFLISVLIYSIAKNIPGVKELNTGLQGAFAGVIGFLSMAYITPEEVFSMMTGYTALGFVLGGFLPLIILLFFTIEMAKEGLKGNAGTRLGRRIMAIMMWIAFSFFAFLRALNADPGSKLLSWIIVGASIIMILSMKHVFTLIKKEMITEVKDKSKETSEKATRREQNLAKAEEVLGGA